MLQKIRFFDKKDPKLSLSESLSKITRIPIYSYHLLCKNDHRHHHKFIKYEKRLRKRGKKHARLTYQATSLPLQREFGRVANTNFNIHAAASGLLA
jgi:hypothetical protein